MLRQLRALSGPVRASTARLDSVASLEQCRVLSNAAATTKVSRLSREGWAFLLFVVKVRGAMHADAQQGPCAH